MSYRTKSPRSIKYQLHSSSYNQMLSLQGRCPSSKPETFDTNQTGQALLHGETEPPSKQTRAPTVRQIIAKKPCFLANNPDPINGSRHDAYLTLRQENDQGYRTRPVPIMNHATKSLIAFHDKSPRSFTIYRSSV
jgi:hypothetical protein